jgi:hypothetical protein
MAIASMPCRKNARVMTSAISRISASLIDMILAGKVTFISKKEDNMSRWSLIVALFVMSSAWSQSATDTPATNPATPAPADGACGNSSSSSVEEPESAESTEAQTAWLRSQKDVIKILASSNDSRMLLAAALHAAPLQMVTPTELATELSPAVLLSRAQKAAPNDPQIWWVSAVQYGGDELNHAREQAIRRLIEIVPQNAAAWLLELDRATAANDAIAARLAIEHAAKAKYFDDYFMAITATLLRAYENVPPSVLTTNDGDADELGLNEASTQKNQRLILSFSLSLASAMPAYQTLVRSCDPKLAVSTDTQLRADCVTIGKLMGGNSTSLISQMFGLHLQRKLAADSTELADIESQLRNMEWLRFNQFRLDDSVSDASIDRRYQQILDGQSEQDSIRALLSDVGVALEPPEDWKSSRQAAPPPVQATAQ